MIRTVFIFVVLAASLAAGAIEFIGVLSSRGELMFAIRTSSDRAPTWRSIGESISGYTITGYDAEVDELTLAKGKELLTLRLPQSKVRDAAGLSASRKSMDNMVAEQIAKEFGNDRTRFLNWLRSRGMTIRSYRNEIAEKRGNGLQGGSGSDGSAQAQQR